VSIPKEQAFARKLVDRYPWRELAPIAVKHILLVLNFVPLLVRS
jgi:hypothetical protein